MLALAIGFLVYPLLRERASRNHALAIGLVLPLATFWTYAQVGAPGAIAHNPPVVVATPRDGRVDSPMRGASVANLVVGLKKRLETTTPDDAGGWLLLAQSYEYLGRDNDAQIAFERARSLGADPRSLPAALPGGDAPATAGEAPGLRGRVALSPAAAGRVRPTDTVFVFAKASADQRMPIAALRRPASDLPFDFALTDREAIVPGTHIGDFETLLVSAQVSRSGRAQDLLAGLSVASATTPTDAQSDIELLISAAAAAGNRNDE
jgi:hypothetical protein